MLDLDLFSSGHGCAQTKRDVVGKVLPAESQHAGMLYRVIGKNGDVACATAKIDQRHADLAFLLGEHGLGRSKGLEHDVGNIESALVA